MVGQAVQALRGQPGAVKLTFARWRCKSAVCKRRVSNFEARKPFVKQLGEVELVAISGAAQDFVSVVKTAVGKTHVRG